MISNKHEQTWSQQRRMCRPAQPLRLGDSFQYHKAETHGDVALFRVRMKKRILEARNAQPE